MKREIDTLINEVRNRYGFDAIQRLGDGPRPIAAHEVLPSGSLNLDRALGVSGWARGRIIELSGAAQTGKKTIALHACVEEQARRGTIAFIDCHHDFNATYAQRIGLQLETTLMAQPDNTEQALEIAEALARSGALSCIVLNRPWSSEEPEEDDKTQIARRAYTQCLRRLTAVAFRTSVIVFFLTLPRDWSGHSQDSYTHPSSGLRFYASVRVLLRRDAPKVVRRQTLFGTLAMVMKNKLAPPFARAEVAIGDDGIDPRWELAELARPYGLLDPADGVPILSEQGWVDFILKLDRHSQGPGVCATQTLDTFRVSRMAKACFRLQEGLDAT